MCSSPLQSLFIFLLLSPDWFYFIIIIVMDAFGIIVFLPLEVIFVLFLIVSGHLEKVHNP